MPPIDNTPERMPSISTSNCLFVWSWVMMISYFNLSSRAERGTCFTEKAGSSGKKEHCPRNDTSRLSEASGDVVLGFLAHRPQEYLVGFAELNQVSKVHVGS